jgi:CRISPR/Cas system-associated endonuclease Cas1
VNNLPCLQTFSAQAKAAFKPTDATFHTDDLHRDSFVYDVMEATRSDVDMWLLDFIRGHKFSARDFYVKKDGGTRLTLKITPTLAETVPIWAKKVEPVIANITKIVLLEEKTQ